jgi:hypothetical protein
MDSSHPRDAQFVALSVKVASSRSVWGRKDATVVWPRGFAKALRGKPEARRNPSRQLTTPREERTRDDTLRRRPKAPLASLERIAASVNAARTHVSPGGGYRQVADPSYEPRRFHHRQQSNAVGTAATMATGTPRAAPSAIVTSAATPAAMPLRRDCLRISCRPPKFAHASPVARPTASAARRR